MFGRREAYMNKAWGQVRSLGLLSLISVGMNAYAESVYHEAVYHGGTQTDQEVTLAWDWQISADTTQSRETPFSLQSKHSYQSVNALLDLEVGYENWLGLFAIKGNDLYSHSSHFTSIDSNSTYGASQTDFEAEFIIRELFWQGEWDLSTDWLGDHYLDVTLGKVRLDWGVGYGYRPLDVIKPYRRNPVGIVAEEGAGVFSLSSFDGLGEWTLIYSDSSWTSHDSDSQYTNELEQQSEQQGFGIRRYGLVGEHEYQWLAYYDDVRHGLLGASVVSVLDLAWEFHGSAVYQRHSLGYQQPKTQPNNLQPVTLSEKDEAYQALVGLTWANEIGNSIILEYWFDSRAWSGSEWKEAINSATLLKSNPATTTLAGSYAQGYQHANIVQHNLMFHWTLDSTAWAHIFSDGMNETPQGDSWGWLSNVTPTLDVLISPEDGGFIVTQWINYQMVDSGSSSVDLELAARFLAGKGDSAYANLPDSHIFILNIKGRF